MNRRMSLIFSRFIGWLVARIVRLSVTPPNWLAIVRRSLETATRASTATAVRHLYAMAEIARLKRKAEAEVYIVSIPGDWAPPVAGTFVKETMNNLSSFQFTSPFCCCSRPCNR